MREEHGWPGGLPEQVTAKGTWVTTGASWAMTGVRVPGRGAAGANALRWEGQSRPWPCALVPAEHVPGGPNRLRLIRASPWPRAIGQQSLDAVFLPFVQMGKLSLKGKIVAWSNGTGSKRQAQRLAPGSHPAAPEPRSLFVCPSVC